MRLWLQNVMLLCWLVEVLLLVILRNRVVVVLEEGCWQIILGCNKVDISCLWFRVLHVELIMCALVPRTLRGLGSLLRLLLLF